MEKTLSDIQSSVDYRGVHFNQVGVSEFRYPISVLDQTNAVQHTIAQLSMLVSLPPHIKVAI